MSDLQNTLFDNITQICYSLSFYSPIIICVSIVLFSMFTSSIGKAFAFFVCIAIITFIRIIVFKGLKTLEPNQIPSICSTGLSELFIPQDITYSTFILTFTMMYLITPMIMISTQNKMNFINYRICVNIIKYIFITSICM